jgi:hypothetical protein
MIRFRIWLAKQLRRLADWIDYQDPYFASVVLLAMNESHSDGTTKFYDGSRLDSDGDKQ